jgi:ligand-binding sensor domain-containing protein
MKFFTLFPDWIFNVILLVFFWFLQGNFALVNSQTYAFQHVTEKEGLPSTYLYGILQDKRGYIWLTGESGLLWYNGLVYLQPEIQNKIENEIIRFFDVDSEKIWMQDLAGKLLYYENGEIHNFPEINPNLIYRYTEVFSHSNGDIWIANAEDVFIFKNETDSLVRLNVDNTTKALLSIKNFSQTENGETVLLTESGFYVFSGEGSSFIPYKHKEAFDDFNLGFSKGGNIYVVLGGNIFNLNLDTYTLEPYHEGLEGYFKDEVIDFYEDKNGDSWFATRNGIIKIVEKGNNEYEVNRFLEGEVMGGIMEDNENNIWFITGQNGLFVLPSLDVEIFQKTGVNQQVRFVKQNNKGLLVLGYDNNQFEVLDTSFNVVQDRKLFEQNSRLYDMINDEKGDQYFITSEGYVQFDEAYNLKNKSYDWSLKSAVFTPDGSLWIGTGYFFGRTIGDKKVEKLLNKRTYSLFPISDNEVWVGTIEGLFLYKDGKCTKVENQLLDSDIRDIKMLENGDLFLATQKSGLLHYRPSIDSILHHFTKSNGLSNDNCNKILLDEKFIWVGTKKGVNRINRTDYSITMIGLDQGLPSNEVNDIYKIGDQIYVATNRGVAIFKDDIDLYRTPPHLQITNIKINEKDTVFQSQYRLSYDKNNIKIEFSAITFKDAKQTIYNYKMDGIDQDWIQSNINVAQYPSLPPGKYNFIVKTKTTNSEWSDERKVSFEIDSPFWERWWFFVLTGLLFIGFSYLVFSEVNKRRSVLRDMRASQLTALRTQMNPHFLFNALNSIQEFIVNKDVRSANRYLTRFAKLMRNILNVSDKDRITLGKEIESLHLYLSLEALRFGDSFEYFLEVEDNIDKDAMYLPPMLVQPFVENAIKHGLMHRKGSKKLYLRFYLKDNSLICEIEDNGVGREMAAEIRNRNLKMYTSKATSLTDERIKLFNLLANNSLSVEVIDKKDKEIIPIGTKVVLTINSNFKGF